MKDRQKSHLQNKYILTHTPLSKGFKKKILRVKLHLHSIKMLTILLLYERSETSIIVDDVIMT